jgi:hypothetical protein
MEYLVEHVEASAPNLLNLSRDFTSVKAASTLNITTTKGEVLRLKVCTYTGSSYTLHIWVCAN